MDWGFTKVQSFSGEEYSVAMVCHHCGERYVEFFPNAKQENLFIGMIYGFQYMGAPQDMHVEQRAAAVTKLNDSPELLFYLCLERRISFNGFVNYEGRRFGVPYSYSGKTARVMRSGSCLYIYSADMNHLLTTHEVTWSCHDSFFDRQYALPEQSEEFPSMPVKTVI